VKRGDENHIIKNIKKGKERESGGGKIV